MSLEQPVTGLSPSSLDLWEQCPLKFRKEKLEGRSGGTGEAALLGTYVHLILELLMELPARERTVKTARSTALDAWVTFTENREWRQWVSETGFDDVPGFRRQAWASVCGYFQIEDPVDVEVIATERFLTTQLGDVPVRGIVDRLERDVFGDLVISDYKTGKVPAPWFRASKMRQLNLYAAMVEQVDDERPAEGRLLFTSFSEVVATTITRESIEQATEQITEAWDAIGSAARLDVWESKPGPLCGWCPFVGECDAGLAEVRERRAAGKLKRTAPAWELAADAEEE